MPRDYELENAKAAQALTAANVPLYESIVGDAMSLADRVRLLVRERDEARRLHVETAKGLAELRNVPDRGQPLSAIAAESKAQRLEQELATSRRFLVEMSAWHDRNSERNRKALDLLGITYPGLCNDKVWGGGVVEGIEALKEQLAEASGERDRLTKLLNDRMCQECGGAGEHCIDRAYGGEHYQDMVACPACNGDGRTEEGAQKKIAAIGEQLATALHALANERQVSADLANTARGHAPFNGAETTAMLQEMESETAEAIAAWLDEWDPSLTEAIALHPDMYTCRADDRTDDESIHFHITPSWSNACLLVMAAIRAGNWRTKEQG